MSTYRNLAISSGRLTSCARCGYSNAEALEVHHKDRDRTNNEIDNLEVLCSNCHKLEHKANKRPHKKRVVPAKILIAIRVPDDLAARLDTRCSIRKQSKTKALLEAIERGWDEAVSQPEPTAHRPASPLSIPGVFLGSQLTSQTAPVYEPEPEPLEMPMCSYTEYDGQTGETYTCGLRVHSNKVRHTRGAVIR